MVTTTGEIIFKTAKPESKEEILQFRQFKLELKNLLKIISPVVVTIMTVNVRIIFGFLSKGLITRLTEVNTPNIIVICGITIALANGTKG